MGSKVQTGYTAGIRVPWEMLELGSDLPEVTNMGGFEAGGRVRHACLFSVPFKNTRFTGKCVLLP